MRGGINDFPKEIELVTLKLYLGVLGKYLLFFSFTYGSDSWFFNKRLGYLISISLSISFLWLLRSGDLKIVFLPNVILLTLNYRSEFCCLIVASLSFLLQRLIWIGIWNEIINVLFGSPCEWLKKYFALIDPFKLLTI